MKGRNQTYPEGFSPFYSQHTAIMGRGGQIDWSKVPNELFLTAQFTVQLNGAVAVGADSLTVDALTRPLKAGQFLRGVDVPTVDITISASALANATSVSVNALTDAIPSGATIKLSGSKKYITLTAGAAKGATSLAVEGLATALAGGETGTFQGGENNIEVLADASIGATSVSVGNIQFPMADNTQLKATDTFSTKGRKIKRGTIMARTTEGFLIPRLVATNETACGFLYSDADEMSLSDARSGYGLVVGGTPIWENLLPDVIANGGTMPSGYKTELVANGIVSVYQTWLDSRTV